MGQVSGVKATHVMQLAFHKADNKAILLVDASNAFNSLNHAVTLLNVQRLCSSFVAIINIYQNPVDLFVDRDVIHLCEGTTQGDPLAMSFYALATILFIRHLTCDIDQVWYADDAIASGSNEGLDFSFWFWFWLLCQRS